ncbi:MAG: hypothetical protein FWD68_03735 [Alphaproteobacteria bacterium]|nr:hypothetical protein [Alphaproteobacteria bacterium]
MKIDASRMTASYGYFEGGADAAEPSVAARAMSYKKDVCRNYVNLNTEQMDARLVGSEFYATRKYDGEMNVLFFDGAEAAIVNRSGKIRTKLACVEDARAALDAAGVTQAVIACELHVDEAGGRTRIFDVLGALADTDKAARLRLAAFDILELNNEPFRPNSYGDSHSRLTALFTAAKLTAAVDARKCRSKAEVREAYREWVEEGGAEGLVVRSDMPLVFKVKPRYTIDVVVVGFSEGTGEAKGQVRSLLLALSPAEGEFQIIGRTGNGFSDEARAALLTRLEPMQIDSRYIETDSNHVAFRMIRPEIVIELMINDVLFETQAGSIQNPLLCLENGAYAVKGSVHGISVVFPIFVRFRDDKKAVHEDIRLEQINAFSCLEEGEAESPHKLESSSLLRREVYRKESGKKLMVQKFMVWKTNKPAPDYPAYVFHYTNFSSDRKEPLQREVVISDDEAQILAVCEQSIRENVKKGWNAVG